MDVLTHGDNGQNDDHFDLAFLAEQLKVIQAACEDYNDTEAYAALDRLKEKKWKPQTTAALERINDMLFLHSDFDGAAEQAKVLLNGNSI